MSRSLSVSRGLHSMGAKPVSEKGRSGNDHRAKSWVMAGNTTPGANEGVTMKRATSIRRRQPTLVGQPIFVGIDEKQAAQSFAAAVIHFDAHTLARAAGRDIETARVWKAGKRAPNSTSLINMGRTIREVQDWVNGEIESRKPHVPVEPAAGFAALALLQQEAVQPGERGAMARAMLTQLSRGA